MRNQRTYLANQDNKHRLEDECTDFSLNTSRNGVGEVSKRSRSKSKFSCKYGGARRDREPSRLQCKKIIKMFQKSKSSRKCIKRYIMYNTPYSSAMKNFLSIDFQIYLTTTMQVISTWDTCQKSTKSKKAIISINHRLVNNLKNQFHTFLNLAPSPPNNVETAQQASTLNLIYHLI